MTSTSRLARARRDDCGAVLLIALVFVFAVGMVIAAVATLATGAFTTTYNLHQERDLEANAESAATLAIDNMRYSYAAGVFDAAIDTSTPDCMPGATPYQGLATYCWGYSNPGSPNSRTVNFYVCPAGSTYVWPSSFSFQDPPPECNNVLLYAQVIFDDLPPNAPPSADNCPTVVTPDPSTCGIVMTVHVWDVRTADN